MARFLVTGASGFVGRAVVHELAGKIQSDDEVLVLSRQPLTLEDSRFSCIVGDLAHEGAWTETLGSIDCLIHLAAHATFPGDAQSWPVNVDGTRNLLSGIQKIRKPRRIVFISSIAALDRSLSDACLAPLSPDSSPCPRTIYGKSKLAAETLVQESGIPYTIFRPAIIYGPGMRGGSHLRLFGSWVGRFPLIGCLRFPGVSSLIHVNDLAMAIVEEATKGAEGNRSYLAATEALSIGQVLKSFREFLAPGSLSLGVNLRWCTGIINVLGLRRNPGLSFLFFNYFYTRDPDFNTQFFSTKSPRVFTENIGDIFERRL